MLLSIIVAMDRNRGIGYQGNIPWRLSADLRRFRRLTTGRHIIFGRKTYQSIGVPLPDRKVIILTKKSQFSSPNAVFVTSDFNEAIQFAKENGEEELFIGGGEEIYKLYIDMVDRIYLTYVHTQTEADRYFPALNSSEWMTSHVEHIPTDEKNQFPSTFIILKRKQTVQ